MPALIRAGGVMLAEAHPGISTKPAVMNRLLSGTSDAPTLTTLDSSIQAMTVGAAVATPYQNSSVVAERLGALFDAHHKRLFRLARRLSRNPEDARDLVQETFLRAARAPSSVPSGACNEEAWLVRVLINLCRDRWRQTTARGQLDKVADTVQVLRPADPETALVARSVVWHALDTLSPRRRAVLVMHELEGLSIEDIARTVGVTAVTVRWHLSRGRRQMAAVIRSEGSDV